MQTECSADLFGFARVEGAPGGGGVCRRQDDLGCGVISVSCTAWLMTAVDYRCSSIVAAFRESFLASTSR
jgi:hypothetical protein